MPELPDVEMFKKYLDATSLHKKDEVRSSKVLRDDSVSKIKGMLQGHVMESTLRHEKHLFVRMDDGHWLMLHFGMIGDLRYFKEENEKMPYARVMFHFDNGFTLACLNKRQLGKVRLLKDREAFMKEKKLGPDALSLDPESFQNMLDKQRGTIKSFLMNQKRIAGIGNIFSEILFQSGIHPRSKVGRLGDESMKKLFRAMDRILKKAIE